VGTDRARKPAIEVTTDFGAESTGQTGAEAKSESSANACERSDPARALAARNAMVIWQDLVDGHGFAASYQSVNRFLNKLRGSTTPEARVVIETAPGEEAQVNYGSGPMLRECGQRQVPAHTAVRDDSGAQPKIRPAVGVPLQHARLGGVARESVSPIGRRDSRCSAGQSPRRRDHSRHLRCHAQSALSRRAEALRRRRVALPGARSGSKGKVESAVGHSKKTPLKGLRFESLEETQ
jgi:hypothetical protein